MLFAWNPCSRHGLWYKSAISPGKPLPWITRKDDFRQIFVDMTSSKSQTWFPMIQSVVCSRHQTNGCDSCQNHEICGHNHHPQCICWNLTKNLQSRKSLSSCPKSIPNRGNERHYCTKYGKQLISTSLCMCAITESRKAIDVFRSFSNHIYGCNYVLDDFGIAWCVLRSLCRDVSYTDRFSRFG